MDLSREDAPVSGFPAVFGQGAPRQDGKMLEPFSGDISEVTQGGDAAGGGGRGARPQDVGLLNR